MILTEVHQIRRTHKLFKFLDNLSFQSKNIFNMANYIVRQEFINTSKEVDVNLRENAKWIRWCELDKIMKRDYPEVYNLLPAKSTQLILKNLDESWKSFFESVKMWKSTPSKFKGKPNLPQYKNKEVGRNVVLLSNQQFKIKNGIVSFIPTLTKDIDFKPIKTKIGADAKLLQITISPKKAHYNFNIIYEVPDNQLDMNEGLDRKTGEILEINDNSCMAIDLGVNNFCTVSNNVDKDFFIINGRQIKSINQWANKYQSFNKIGQAKKNKTWRNRENKLNYFFNKTADLLISKALAKGCGKIVVGHNEGWKQKVNLGRKTNQSFVQIPYNKFLFLLKYKCVMANIELVEINEAYTSKCSFVDNEAVCKHEVYVGDRVKRGLFKTAKGLLINADLNGSLNILKKYLGTKSIFLTDVEDFVVSPYRISFNF